MARGSISVRRLAVVTVACLIVIFIVRTYSGALNNNNNQIPVASGPPSQGSSESVNQPGPRRPNQRPLNHDGPTSSPRSRISLEMQEHLKWSPPIEIKEHYPPYGDYGNRDYDPNRWEIFDQNQHMYTNATLESLESSHPSPYDPYPAYNLPEWSKIWQGKYEPCLGPLGRPYDKSSDEVVQAYRGVPKGFPAANTGGYGAVGLDSNVCFDRFSRFGPYGMTEDKSKLPDFGRTDWMKLQNDCLELNKDRYSDSKLPKIGPEPEWNGDQSSGDQQNLKRDSGSPSYKSRTAILIRTWDNYKYEENDIQAIRSLVTELNLLSGGEYHVFLFVNVKDPSLPLYTDRKLYDELLVKFVPEELRSMAILWTEAVSFSWYPKVQEWSVYFQQFMPVQWFSKEHPEYEYIWNWEMDARYIGNHYHFLETISKFARQQPRKYLWERNARYYFPAVHGSYENFTADTNKIVKESPWVKPVWGPDKWKEDQVPRGPTPPTSEDDDNFSWGVGEEADFITLLPMWDPRETFWSFRDKLWGYPESNVSAPDRPYSQVPRRTFINTVVRLSRQLLDVMHEDNTNGVSMASEMWPSSTALQHGFKGVYAPHPIWFAHEWPSDYLEQVINADGWGAGSGTGNIDQGHGAAYDADREVQGITQQGTGPNREGKLGRWGQERDSPYNPDREHNFGGWSWYFWSDFPKVLYWRWHGWKASFNIVTIQGVSSNDELRDVDWKQWEKDHGRMCLPGMLLHPVKNVKPPEGY